MSTTNKRHDKLEVGDVIVLAGVELPPITELYSGSHDSLLVSLSTKEGHAYELVLSTRADYVIPVKDKPRPLQPGDKARTPVGLPVRILAIDNGSAWVRYDDGGGGYGTYPLSLLTRQED